MEIKKCNTCGCEPNVVTLMPDSNYMICPNCGKCTPYIHNLDVDSVRELLIAKWNEIN